MSPAEEIGETPLLAALLGIGEMVGELTETEEILASVVRVAPSLVRVDRCAILAYNGLAREFRVLAAFSSGNSDPALESLRMAEADMPRLAQRLVDGRLPALVTESSTDLLLPPGVMKRLHAKAVLLVPLSCRGRFLGCLWLDRVGVSHYFTSREINVLQGIATELAVVLDNAERARVLDCAHRSFEALARALSDGVIVLTADFRVESLEAGAEALLGWTSDEVRGRRIEALLDISDAEAAIAWRRAKSGPRPAAKEISLRTREGKRISCEVLAVPVKGSGGDVSQILYVLRSRTGHRTSAHGNRAVPNVGRGAQAGSPRE